MVLLFSVNNVALTQTKCMSIWVAEMSSLSPGRRRSQTVGGFNTRMCFYQRRSTVFAA